VPDGVLTNADLEACMDTSDAWIVERTGVRERRVAGVDDSTTSLAIAAGANALKSGGLVPDDVDTLIVATVTPDQAMPATSSFVHAGLGLRCGAFDVGAACAGFVYALIVAAAMPGVRLLIGAETLTRVIDPADRTTRPLFGDGAGALLLTDAGPASDAGVIAWDTGCDSSAAHLLEIAPGERYVTMDGKEVFRRAVRAVVDSTSATLERAGVGAADVALFVPHQANARIIDAAASRLGVPMDRTVVNIDRYGNTSAASIPIALAEAADAGRIDDGDLVLLSGFGAGMTWATALLRWETAA
jgi:3-oxoacyl-[acyl-carrier-protein] synthase-3